MERKKDIRDKIVNAFVSEETLRNAPEYVKVAAFITGIGLEFLALAIFEGWV